MNHRNITLAVAAIVAAAALTGVAFAIPQQVMAGGHRHGHNNNGGSIKVDQAINQLNDCNGTSSSPPESTAAAAGSGNSGSGTTCVNLGENTADIQR